MLIGGMQPNLRPIDPGSSLPRYAWLVTAQEIAALPTRQALIEYIQFTVPLVQAEGEVANTRGGRRAALAALAAVRPELYARTRNYLSGAVTRLSPYLRHGVLTLAEVRDHALAAVRDPTQALKLVQELAWRDYWQRVYSEIGDDVNSDREPYKTGFAATEYASALPPVLTSAHTTLHCMDSFSRELQETGYLHNHARMWMAAYTIHWLRVRWQSGARWFLEHLLDGDPASNNLSWQWVASTFSSKPYIFNRENFERYTEGRYCRECVHARARSCPFNGTYEELEQQLFPRMHDAAMTPVKPWDAVRKERKPSPAKEGRPLLWVHTDALNPEAQAYKAYPDAEAIFVWDTAWFRTEAITLKRAVFLAECVAEMKGRLRVESGDVASRVLEAARRASARFVLACRTPDTRLLAAAVRIEREVPVVWVDPPPFVQLNRGTDLKRFSRYWQRAQVSAMRFTVEQTA